MLFAMRCCDILILLIFIVLVIVEFISTHPRFCDYYLFNMRSAFHLYLHFCDYLIPRPCVSRFCALCDYFSALLRLPAFAFLRFSVFCLLVMLDTALLRYLSNTNFSSFCSLRLGMLQSAGWLGVLGV